MSRIRTWTRAIASSDEPVTHVQWTLHSSKLCKLKLIDPTQSLSRHFARCQGLQLVPRTARYLCHCLQCEIALFQCGIRAVPSHQQPYHPCLNLISEVGGPHLFCRRQSACNTQTVESGVVPCIIVVFWSSEEEPWEKALRTSGCEQNEHQRCPRRNCLYFLCFRNGCFFFGCSMNSQSNVHRQRDKRMERMALGQRPCPIQRRPVGCPLWACLQCSANPGFVSGWCVSGVAWGLGTGDAMTQ